MFLIFREISRVQKIRINWIFANNVEHVEVQNFDFCKEDFNFEVLQVSHFLGVYGK